MGKKIWIFIPIFLDKISGETTLPLSPFYSSIFQNEVFGSFTDFERLLHKINKTNNKFVYYIYYSYSHIYIKKKVIKSYINFVWSDPPIIEAQRNVETYQRSNSTSHVGGPFSNSHAKLIELHTNFTAFTFGLDNRCIDGFTSVPFSGRDFNLWDFTHLLIDTKMCIDFVVRAVMINTCI